MVKRTALLCIGERGSLWIQQGFRADVLMLAIFWGLGEFWVLGRAQFTPWVQADGRLFSEDC